MNELAPFAWTISVAGLPSSGVMVSRELSDAERASLARLAGIEAVGSLVATAEIEPWSSGVEMQMQFSADIVQACVVTLAPVPDRLSVTFRRRYLPRTTLRGAETEIELDIEADDPPEPLRGEELDLSVPITEEFILALNPYPRAPDAALPEAALDQQGQNGPFAALERLKGKP